MKVESIKLSLIERLMRENNVSTLGRMKELITQAEMENSAKESLDAIKNGEAMSLEEYIFDIDEARLQIKDGKSSTLDEILRDSEKW